MSEQEDILLEYFKSPKFKGRLENPDCSSESKNPVCGDTVTIDLVLGADGKATIRFDGKGCTISQASAAILTSVAQNKNLAELRELLAAFDNFCSQPLGQSHPPILGDATELASALRFPIRVKCVRLAWETLKQCISTIEATPGEAG